MLRSYQLTDDPAYLTAARAALEWLALPLERGGLSVQLSTGTWYEEYPNASSPSHILNGHMWALFGIWDLYRVTGDDDAKRLFDDGIRALEANIHQYDVSGWSVYSSENRVDFVTGAYQQFIVEQLRVLEVISRSEVLASYRALWECSLLHDGLFVHLAAVEFNKAKGLDAPASGYPSYCNALARDVQPISDLSAVVVRAAAGSPERRRQASRVIEWLPSVGGERWFENYRKQFGSPETSCVLKFERMDVFSKSLQHYYLRHPSKDGKLLVEPDCFVSLGPQYGIADRFTPTIIGHMALANWDAYLVTGEQRYRKQFIHYADRLRSSQTDGRWNWQIEIPVRGLKGPWISGMTQSLGISVLLRAYQLTGEIDYLDRASAAFKWLREPVESGGVSMRTRVGTWFEEYPNHETPSHVLNGHIWALFGIWDYARVTRDPEAERLFREGINVLKDEIDRYDVGYWVVYDQLNRVDMVNGFYISFIIEQLRALYAITGDPQFGRLAGKWTEYQRKHSLFGQMAYDEYMKAAAVRK